MKRIIVLLCILTFCGKSKSQNIPTFWGLNFRTSIEDAKSKIKKDRNLNPENDLSNSSNLTYANCRFSGKEADFIILQFEDNMFYNGAVLLKPSSEFSIFDVYNGFQRDISVLYGKPEKIIEEFEIPFKKGDGKEVLALQSDKAEFSTVWNTQYVDENHYTIICEISMTITKDLRVAIVYTDFELKVQSAIRKRRENMNDL